MQPLSKQPIPEQAKKVFSGVIFDVYQWDQEMFDGTTQVFEKLRRSNTAVVIPITAAGTILMIEEEQPMKKVFHGFPGGRIETGEETLSAAQRELKEETGYEGEDWELIEAMQPVTKIDWTIFTFVARNCRKVAEQSLDGGEKVTLKEVSFEEFLEIALLEDFRMTHLQLQAMEAKYNSEKKEELRQMLFGN